MRKKMENTGEPQDSFVTSTNDSDDCKVAVSELSDLIETLNTDEQQPRKTDSASCKTICKKVDESIPWYPNYLRLSLTIIGTSSLKALQNVISFFHHNISRDVKDAYMRPNRAAKVKVLLSEALVYFHMCFSEIKLPLEQDTYLDQMTDLVSMYIDMELKASRRGKESTKKVSCKLSSSLHTFLNSSIDHILDSVLKSRFMVKSFSEICIPVLRKLLTPPFQQMYEMTYIRYVLAFKLWKRITTDQEEKKQITNIASSIIPPPRLEEMLQDGLLRDVLPPLRKNKKKLPLTTFFVTTKINLKETIKEFMKMYQNSKYNDIADAFDKSRFFKEHRNETNGDDVKDASTELIDSIWTTFSNPSAAAQDPQIKQNQECCNKKKKTKKKAKLKKNEKKKKVKNDKLSKKKSKKTKKKIKLVKKKSNNSKTLLVKGITKNTENIILPTITNLKEKQLLDITTACKESRGNKEDPFMKNFLNVISSFKKDINGGNENHFLNSDSSFLEFEIDKSRNKVTGSEDDDDDDEIHNNTDQIETTSCDSNVIRCGILLGIDKEALEKSDVTPIQEPSDKLTSSKCVSLGMKTNNTSLENSNVIKNAVSSDKCIEITKEIMTFDVKSDFCDSNVKTEVDENNVIYKDNSNIEKICDSLPCKINFNLVTPDVARYTTTDTNMQKSGAFNDDMTNTEKSKETSDMQIDESNVQQDPKVSNKQIIQNASCELQNKTSDRLTESSVSKAIEDSKKNNKMENHLSYSLNELKIAGSVLDSSLENSVSLEKTADTEKNIVPDPENKNNELINLTFQPDSIHVCQHDRSETGFEMATKSVTESSPDSVNKVSDNVFEHVQGPNNKSDQDATKNINKNYISELMSEKVDTEKLISEIIETSSTFVNPVINHSQNVSMSTVGCGGTSALPESNKDINKLSSFKGNKTVDALSCLHSDYRLNSKSSDTPAGEQHLQASDISYKIHYIEEQSNISKSKNTSFSTCLKSFRESPSISESCSGYTKQANVDSEDLLNCTNYDICVNKKITQIGKEEAVANKVVHITDTGSINNEIIVDTNTLTSSEGQCPLKISYTVEDKCPVKSYTESFEEVSPSTEADIIQSVSNPHLSNASTTEGEQYALDSCNINRADNEILALKIKEEKMDLLSDTQMPISLSVEDTSVTDCIKKDMKRKVSNIHNVVVVDIDSNDKPIENVNLSHPLNQVETENNPCMKKMFVLDNKRMWNRKQDNDNSDTVDVNTKHVGNNIKNKCNIQGIPTSVYDEGESVQKTPVYNKNNIYTIRTTSKENVDSCAQTKVFSGGSGNKTMEATNIEKITASVLQEKNIDISRLEDKTIFNKAVSNTNEKFIDTTHRCQLLGLQEEEEKVEAKTISECDSSSRSALNTSRVTKKEKSRSIVKSNVTDILVKNQTAESEQIILDTKIHENKLSSVHSMSSDVEYEHSSQKESHVYQTSSIDANVLDPEEVNLSNSNHLVSSNPASIKIVVKKIKLKGKHNRSNVKRILPAESKNVIASKALNLNYDGLGTDVNSTVEDHHCNKSQNDSSNEDLRNNFKHSSFDVNTKESDDNKQIISFPSNTQTEEKDTPKPYKSIEILAPRNNGNGQDVKSNDSNLHKSKLYNTENSDRSRGNICVANSSTDRKKLSATENNTATGSYHKTSIYTIEKTEKVKFRYNPISDDEQPAEECQTNTDFSPQSKEMSEPEHKNKELSVLSLKFNDYATEKNFSEISSDRLYTDRKQSITPPEDIVSQTNKSDTKQKKGKVSGFHRMPENGNLRKMCSKINDSKAMKSKSNVIESKLSNGPNVHSKNNSVWKMISLDSPDTSNCLPETSYSVGVNKLSERNESNLGRESVKQSLVLSKCNDKDECLSAKSGKMYKANSETLDRKYVPVKDSSTSLKMKFVKLPVEKYTVKASNATTKHQKQHIDKITVKKSELLQNKEKKTKDSSFRHYENEKISDANIETSSLSAEEKNSKKVPHVKKYDNCLITRLQTKSATCGDIQCKSLTTIARGVQLRSENKLCRASEKVNTIEEPSAQSLKKLSISYSDPDSSLLVNSSEMQYAEVIHNSVPDFEKEENVSFDMRAKRKRKRSIHSPRKDHNSNKKNNMSSSKEAIPVLNLMKLPNNQWSDKAKLDLEPYVKLKKLTEHEVLTLTNHTVETPVLNQDLHNSGSNDNNSKLEHDEHTSKEEVNKDLVSDGVAEKRYRLVTMFIKHNNEWRIAEPAFLFLEISAYNMLDSDTHTDRKNNGIRNNNVDDIEIDPHYQLENSGDACKTQENLNDISRTKSECSVNIEIDSSQNMLCQNVGSTHQLPLTKLKTHDLQNTESKKHQFISLPESDSNCVTQNARTQNSVGSPNQLSTTKLKTCILKNIESEKHLFIPQHELDSNHVTQKAGTRNNTSQKSSQYVKNACSLTHNITIPNQLCVKSSSKEFTSDLLVDKCEVTQQNSAHQRTSDSSLPNSEVKRCTLEIQHPPKKVMFLRHVNSDQISVSSSAKLSECMSQASCQPSSSSHNYSTYSENMQTEGSVVDKSCCQRLTEKDNYHLDANTVVHVSTDDRCTGDGQNMEISVATSSAVNNTVIRKNEFQTTYCNVSERTVSRINESSINNCSKSSSSEHSMVDAQAMLHDWTVSNLAVPETPLDYTVPQSQTVDSWTVLNSRHKNSIDGAQMSVNEIQDLLKLQQISTDIKTYSEYGDRKLTGDEYVHSQTCHSDYDVCCSQMKYRDYLLLEVSNTATLPYPPQIPGDAHHPVSRCCCQECCRNYHTLISNYNKLSQYRSLKIKTTAVKRQRDTGEMLAQLEREHHESDSSLPLKKRKTLTLSTNENMIDSYPNTLMISIAHLQLPDYNHSKSLTVPNPSVPLYSRIGTEPVPSQYIARTNEWNFQNCAEDQNHLPINSTEPNSLGGRNLINCVAQNNMSQYIVSGQEETARVKRELKRQKQSLR